MIEWTQHKGKTQAGGRGLHGRRPRLHVQRGLHGRDARAYMFRGLHGRDARAYMFRGLHGRDARAYMFSRMLSIRRVVPTNAATATNAPCETSSTGSRVSGLTISK